MSDECDERTGQCSCVDATVTGRDCSKCSGVRHILSSVIRTCKNCDDGCAGELLDSVDEIVQDFDDADVSDLDPAPMLRLIRLQQNHSRLSLETKKTKKCQASLQRLSAVGGQLKPQAELADLEAKKYLKSAEDIKTKSIDQFKKSKTTNSRY